MFGSLRLLSPLFQWREPETIKFSKCASQISRSPNPSALANWNAISLPSSGRPTQNALSPRSTGKLTLDTVRDSEFTVGPVTNNPTTTNANEVRIPHLQEKLVVGLGCRPIRVGGTGTSSASSQEFSIAPISDTPTSRSSGQRQLAALGLRAWLRDWQRRNPRCLDAESPVPFLLPAGA